MLSAFLVAILVSTAVGLGLLVRRERVAYRLAKAETWELRNQARDVQDALDAVTEEGRRKGEILASIRVVRRLDSDVDPTTGPMSVVAVLPDDVPRTKRKSSRPERIVPSARRAARRTTTN